MDLDLNQISPLIIIAAIWSLPWKGVAMWKAAQNKSVWWFVALLITNTFALLDMLYIFYFSKKQKEAEKPKKAKRPTKVS